MNCKLLITLLCILSGWEVAAVTIADLQRRFVPDTIDERTSLFWDGLAQSPAFGRPFWADMHSTLTRGEVAYATNSTDYDWANKDVAYRSFVFANLGADLPLWSGNFAKGKYGVSLTLPFLIDVWLDMFERTTAPVINTGYRFGAFEVGFIHRLEEPFWRIKNYSLRLSPLKHECTHIGDELTIARMNDSTLKITRVNVSYNYSELMLTVNDPEGSLHSNHAFRFGLLVLHDFRRGYYDILPQEADEDIVEPSHRPFEYYLQYQYQSKLLLHNLQAIVSVEMRSRERYNYPFSYSGRLQDYWEQHPDRRDMVLASPDKVCTNVFVGLRYNNPKSKAYYSKIGVGFRYYGGINPYGQFRSQPSYSQWGLSLMFE
ncbi:hypothetical protein FACS189456_2510 [Bacteroidia bacterium]|nr:hypothetical protein FACS189456_2510 [Bacteroidia bacterium]